MTFEQLQEDMQKPREIRLKEAYMAEGRKNDQGKLRMELVPVTAINAMARGFGYGADKYEAYNWTKGLSTSRLYAATMRHLTAWWDGEEMDPESGLSHLDHILCCVAMLEGTVTGGLAEDDRPRQVRKR